ncbi:hypothetical protein [Streptomyces sp. NPDC005568]|uniref:hypothetical protein n=1 Tax=Streptomyces sp. NPDC005568 TaxID=3156887 RepID=UPI0033A4BACC
MQGNAGQGPQGPEVWIRGPVTGPDQERPQGAPGTVTARRFAWVATHGGAGATTLATVFGGHDAGRNWPRPDQGEPGSLLLVARTHATGLEAVSHTLDTFRRGDVPPGLDLDAVVLVADAPGRLPRPLAQHVKAIGADWSSVRSQPESSIRPPSVRIRLPNRRRCVDWSALRASLTIACESSCETRSARDERLGSFMISALESS